MSKRVAVVTDAVSPEFYFPLWYRYYAGQFGGPSHLHVVTFDAELGSFAPFNLGSVTPISKYNNDLRADVINQVVSRLLNDYDVVVRVDADEFLVPDAKLFKSLAEYIDTLKVSHVTAYGFNLIPDRDEPPLDINSPILCRQRHLVQPADALCKTCITSIPLRWAPGFHFCSEMPCFDSLFLFHAKLADVDIQLQIGERVASFSDEQMFIEYHKTARETFEKRIDSIRQNRRVSGPDALYRTEYFRKFLDQVSYTDSFGGMYHGGSFAQESVLVELPSEFAGKF